jgi:hypothetical protein
MQSLKHLIESLIRADESADAGEEAKSFGWKHIGFGTYEDQSGNHYRKNSGTWELVGTKDKGVAPATAPWSLRKPDGSPNPWPPKEADAEKTPEEDTWQAQAARKKAAEREQTREAIKGEITPMINRDLINSIDDEEEREHYSAVADLAELEDDDALRKALKDERMADITSDTLVSAAHRSAGSKDGQEHLDDLSNSLHDLADIMNRNSEGAGLDHSPYDAAMELLDGEQNYGSETLIGIRKALAHEATSAAEYYSKQAAVAPAGNIHGEYESRVSELEGEGMTRSDAQGIADMEFDQKHGRGWESSSLREMIRSITQKLVREELRRK